MLGFLSVRLFVDNIFQKLQIYV